MTDATKDLNNRLNNIEESVDLLQQQVELIVEIIEKANLKENKVSETISASVILINYGSKYK